MIFFVRQIINLKDYNILEVNRTEQKDEPTPELQAYQQQHLSHFLKCQPSDVKKRVRCHYHQAIIMIMRWYKA